MTVEESYADFLLRHGVGPSSRAVYRRVLGQIGKDDPVRWLTQRIDSQEYARTTLAVNAAAIGYWLAWKHGISLAEAKARLPVIKGRKGRHRDAVSDSNLEAFEAAVTTTLEGAARYMLLFLPHTGLRISEAATLRRSAVTTIETDDGPMQALRIVGKGQKERLVPLTKRAEAILADALAHAPNALWVFAKADGAPLSPQQVRRKLQKVRDADPRLASIVPHRLRHTFATRLSRRGVGVDRLQHLLGHANVSTTTRYVHPDAQDLARSVRVLEDGED